MCIRDSLCGHHDILTSGKAPIAAAVYLSLRQRLLLQPDENIRPPLRYASRPVSYTHLDVYKRQGPNGQYSKADIPEHTQYDTESLAKFAFSMFCRAMRFAEEQQVPILLDY